MSELHTSFALAGGGGAVALSRLYNGQPQVLDYVNYTNLPPNWSYGSLPNGQSFVRVEFYSPTPGAGTPTTDGPPPPRSSLTTPTVRSIRRTSIPCPIRFDFGQHGQSGDHQWRDLFPGQSV